MGKTIFFILGSYDQCFDFDGICIFIVVVYWRGIRNSLVAFFLMFQPCFLVLFFNGECGFLL